jgi:hypothetical protein
MQRLQDVGRVVRARHSCMHGGLVVDQRPTSTYDTQTLPIGKNTICARNLGTHTFCFRSVSRWSNPDFGPQGDDS